MAISSQTDLKTMIEMAVHELYIAQEKIVEIHSTIYEEIHARINQALVGLDEALISQQMDMDEDTHQRYLLACERAHKLEESIKPRALHFSTKKRKRMISRLPLTAKKTLFPLCQRQQSLETTSSS